MSADAIFPTCCIALALLTAIVNWCARALPSPKPPRMTKTWIRWTLAALLTWTVFLVVAHTRGLWTCASVRLETDGWVWSVALGVLAWRLSAATVDRYLLRPPLGETWVEEANAQRAFARLLARRWPRTRRLKRVVGVIVLLWGSVYCVLVLGVVVYQLGVVLDSAPIAIVIGSVLTLLWGGGASWYRQLYQQWVYLVAVGLLYSPLGLLGSMSFTMMTNAQSIRLGLHLSQLQAWRRCAPRGQVLGENRVLLGL